MIQTVGAVIGEGGQVSLIEAASRSVGAYFFNSREDSAPTHSRRRASRARLETPVNYDVVSS